MTPEPTPTDPNTWKEILAIGILIFLFCTGIGSCQMLVNADLKIHLLEESK